MSTETKGEKTVQSASSSDFIIGTLFLTAGLVMKHVCYGEDTSICDKVYHDGHILVIIGSVLLALPFALLLCVGCCVGCFALNK